MGGIKNIEEIFHARPLLIIVFQHDWQGQYHQALQSVNTIQHFHAKLINTEYDVHDNKEGVTVPGYSNNQTNAFSPIDKITELYERLLKEKDEKYAALEQRIQNLEKQK